MAISLDSIKMGGEERPTIDLIYALPGMGKTSLAAGFPNPIFIQTEDGLGKLKMPTFGWLRSYEDVIEAMQVLAAGNHPYKTVILDSAGWLEPLIWEVTYRKNGWANIDAAGYGKGPIAALEYWRVILDGLSWLRNRVGMGVEILAHAGVGKKELPDTENYDQYQPKLNKYAVDLLQEYCENIYFINTRTSVTRSVPKDINSRGLAVGSDQRFLYTSFKPSHMAKNRFDMPAMIPLPIAPAGQAPDPHSLFSAVAQHIPYYRNILKPPSPSAATEPKPVNPSTDDDGAVVNPFASLGVLTTTNSAQDVEPTETSEAAE